MEKAIELDVQYFEDDEFYDKLQRANRESSYRPYQIFWQSASSIRTICSSATCSNFSMSLLIAFALDLFGFGVYPFPPGAAGAMPFHDPLEGTEIIR